MKMIDLAERRAHRSAEQFASRLAAALGTATSSAEDLAELRAIFLDAEREWQEQLSPRAGRNAQ